MAVSDFLLVTLVVAMGALVQGTIGFGLGLLAAPLLVLIDRHLVPGPLLAASAVLTVLMTRREWREVMRDDLRWAVSGRLLGTVVAVGALTALTESRLRTLFAGLVLAAVGLTAIGLRVRPRPKVLTVVGAISGFMSTITSIGGPPMALLYQHESGPRIRGTLSAFFVVGVAMSLGGLRVAGHFGLPELKLAAYLLPGIVLGYAGSRHTAGIFDRGFIRPAVLAVSGLAALAVLLT